MKEETLGHPKQKRGPQWKRRVLLVSLLLLLLASERARHELMEVGEE